MAETKPVLIIGHKNPDTDSICSAVAYSRFKTEVEKIPARACRAGNINAQTRFALETFAAEPPDILTDVYPRIRDIMIPRGQLLLISPADAIAGARSLMLKNRFSFLPVADSDGRCLGRLTALRLAGLMDDLDPYTKAEVELDLRVLTELGRSVSTIVPSGTRSEFPDRVRGAIVPPRRTPGGSRKRSGPTVILGSAREFLHPPADGATVAIAADLRRKSVALKALGRWADENAVPVLATGASLPQVAALLRLSQPVASCLEEIGPTFRSDDTLREVLREVNRSNEGGFIVLDAADRICGVVTRINFMTDARFPVVLVDHNEMSQAVDGIDHANIIEIIDHHRIGGRSTSEPITFVNRAVGSTCTIVTDLYRQSGAEPSHETAGLLLSGILSDTVILRSPTTTPADISAAAWVSRLAEVSMDEYGERMFEAGSAIHELAAREIVERDLKYYEEENIQFSVSQVEMIGFKVFWDRSDELIDEINAHRMRAGLSFTSLMVTDITHGTTLLVMSGEPGIVGQISYPRVADGVFEMKEVLSRKKQVLPYLSELVRGL